jgi:hypothetical protein
MGRKSRDMLRSDEDRMLDEALEETFPASDPVSAEQRVMAGRIGKPSSSTVSHGRSEKDAAIEGAHAVGNRMVRSSKRKGN